MATIALGTAAGDLSAVTWHLGYFRSGVLYAVLILVPAVGRWRFALNAIGAFRFAYILTRPLGASFADWAGVSHARGGLDLGAGTVSVSLALLIIAAVIPSPSPLPPVAVPFVPSRRPGKNDGRLGREFGLIRAT